MTALPSPENIWALPDGPAIALAPPPDDRRAWTRFTRVVAITAGAALLIGMALSYASAYKAAMTAGYDNPWINHGGSQLRPAHLFPLTLDAPALVGYAGTLALAGRRSAAWARLVLWTSGAATIALQVMDGAGWIAEHTWIRAVVHGWPPAVGLLTAHLLVKILQALGVLVPPVADAEGPSWLARAGRWVAQLVADIRMTRRALDRGDMDRDARGDNEPATGADGAPETNQDAGSDITGDDGGDTGSDGGDDNDSDTKDDNTQVNAEILGKLTLKERRVIARVLRGEITQIQAAKAVSKTPRTVARWVAAAKAPARDGAAS